MTPRARPLREGARLATRVVLAAVAAAAFASAPVRAQDATTADAAPPRTEAIERASGDRAGAATSQEGAVGDRDGAVAPRETAIAGALDDYARALEERERGARIAGFARAERGFARAAAEGAHNPSLYTNLGNAALQAGHLGPAVLAYRRALALDRAFPDALQNLDHARAQLPAWVPRPAPAGLLDTLAFHRRISPSARALAGAGAFAIAGAMLALGLRTGHAAFRAGAAVAATAWLLLTGSLALDARRGDARPAVVTLDETLARAADSSLAPRALPEPLPAGTEVTLLEDRSPWVRVRLANGREVWVAASGVTPVEPL
ncbi:MAG: hypothetical protein R3E88_11000 [Myxococcota bacterium]